MSITTTEDAIVITMPGTMPGTLAKQTEKISFAMTWALIGVTMFLLVSIIAVILLYIWFRRR